MKSKIAARKAEIPVITSAELAGIDKTKIGLKGSPTKVKKTFTPNVKKNGKKVVPDDMNECARGLVSFLGEINAL
jgi:electron transfer flavoprotein beta subunit